LLRIFCYCFVRSMPSQARTEACQKEIEDLTPVGLVMHFDLHTQNDSNKYKNMSTSCGLHF
jgi:hypothetical protein